MPNEANDPDHNHPSNPKFRPLPNDVGAEEIMQSFDAHADNWLLGHTGDIISSVAETMTSDGGNYQKVIMLQFPVRANVGSTGEPDEPTTLRIMFSPEMASIIVSNLAHALTFLHEYNGRFN